MLHSLLYNPQLTPAGAGLAGALIGAGSTLAITFVNGFFNRNRFQRERLWERRQAACNDVISALRAAQGHAVHIRAGFAENAEAYFASQRLDESYRQYNSFIRKASEAFHFNYLILPAPFRARFEKLAADQLQNENATGPDIYLVPIALYEAAATDLMDIALVELSLDGFWSRQAASARRVGRAIKQRIATLGQA